MFRYYVYIETFNYVVPVVIYASCKKDAYSKAVQQFENSFKSRAVNVITHKNHYYFGGFEY
ncbi:hypothetical protein PM594_15475 [Erysipelatoclostridium ramosum]|uniref:hypothetical protein n=1 Tax=Thomasclavelia ramosa TaxID=1547 RepID=UPI0018A01326|nr:hypothetical protein [Thomasclavelia ramosa]MDB7040957.1 hypothetical protein [Thomasclavelia ramosa]